MLIKAACWLACLFRDLDQITVLNIDKAETLPLRIIELVEMSHAAMASAMNIDMTDIAALQADELDLLVLVSGRLDRGEGLGESARTSALLSCSSSKAPNTWLS
jgi:hypothetical protein